MHPCVAKVAERNGVIVQLETTAVDDTRARPTVKTAICIDGKVRVSIYGPRVEETITHLVARCGRGQIRARHYFAADTLLSAAHYRFLERAYFRASGIGVPTKIAALHLPAVVSTATANCFELANFQKHCPRRISGAGFVFVQYMQDFRVSIVRHSGGGLSNHPECNPHSGIERSEHRRSGHGGGCGTGLVQKSGVDACRLP